MIKQVRQYSKNDNTLYAVTDDRLRIERRCQNDT